MGVERTMSARLHGAPAALPMLPRPMLPGGSSYVIAVMKSCAGLDFGPT
jgi:hypothetical protein